MTPYDEDRVLLSVAAFRRDHPQVHVSPPDETRSGMWEVSFAGDGGTATFDSPGLMLRCLSYIGLPEDDED